MPETIASKIGRELPENDQQKSQILFIECAISQRDNIFHFNSPLRTIRTPDQNISSATKTFSLLSNFPQNEKLFFQSIFTAASYINVFHPRSRNRGASASLSRHSTISAQKKLAFHAMPKKRRTERISFLFQSFPSY